MGRKRKRQKEREGEREGENMRHTARDRVE
jgi:hypothetical protein